MEISDVRVRIVDANAGDRLKAVCTVTLDEMFVVRDVKVVEGSHGPFVAMPSRKLSLPCPKCRTQNHLRAKHCNECGKRLPPPRIPSDDDGREKVHRDIAHPITAAFRQIIQESVLDAYEAERGDIEEEQDTETRFEVEQKEEEVEVTESQTEGKDDFDDEDEEEREEKKGEISEYDAIIADLRGDRTRFVKDRDGGAKSGPSEPRDKASDGPGRRRRGRRRPDRDDRPDRDRPAKAAEDQKRETPPPAPAPQPPRVREPEPARVREPEPARCDAPREEPEVESNDGFAAGLLDTPAPRRAPSPRPAAPVSAPEPVVQEPAEVEEASEPSTDDSNDTGFGAGIL